MNLSDLALLSLASTSQPESNTSGESDVGKVKKRRVSKACIACNLAHVSCEKARPCARCITKGIECKDSETAKRRGRKPGSPPNVVPTAVPTHDPTISQNVLEFSPSSFASPIIQYATTPQSNSELPPISSPLTAFTTSSFTALNPGSLDFLLETYWQGIPLDTQIEANIMSPAIEGNLNPDTLEKETDMLSKFISMFREKLTIPGIEIDAILLQFSQERTRIWKYIAEKNKEVTACDTYIMTIMHNFKDEIANTIEKYRQLFEPLASPTILWDRIGQIHYVNPAYKAITGFHYPLPTEKLEFAIYKHIFCPETVLEYCLTELATMREYPNTQNLNAYAMKCSVRVHTELAEKYIPGNMVLNIKKDSFGVPYLYIGTFFPTDFPKWAFKESHKDLCI